MNTAPPASPASLSVRGLTSAVIAAMIGVGLLVLFVFAAPQLWYPLWFDQGAFAACADVLRYGGVMYRDCWDVRGPAAVLAYHLPLLLSPSPVAVHAFDLLCQALTALLLGRLAAAMFGRRAGVIAGVLYWLMYASVNYWATAQAEGFANLFLVLALYGAWRVGDNRQQTTDNRLQTESADGRQSHRSHLWSVLCALWSPWLFISGACVGVAFWFKYPFALIGVLPAALLLVRRRNVSDTGVTGGEPSLSRPPMSEQPLSGTPSAVSRRLPVENPRSGFDMRRRPLPVDAENAMLMLAGFAAVLLVGLAYFALTGSISNLQSQIAYDIATFHNVSMQYRLEWLRTIFWEEVVAFVSFGNTPTAGFKDTVQQVTILGRGYPFVFALMAIGLVAGLWRRRTRTATLYALGYFVVAVFINLWQGHFYRYHFVIVLPAMALLASSADFGLPIADLRLTNIRRSSFVARQFTGFIVLALVAGAVIGLGATMLPWAQDALNNVVVQGKSASDIYGESKLAPYSLVARALNEQTAPDERIVVFSDVPAVYALAQRRSGTRFPYLRWVQEAGSVEVRDHYAQEFLDDLMRNRPRFFVLTQPDFPWPGADFISLWKSLPAIHQYVEANYHYVGENGPFLLFMRNEP